MRPLVLQSLIRDRTTDAAFDVLGFALLACLTAVAVAFAYRAATNRSMPVGLGVLLGVTGVAATLNAQAFLQETLLGELPKLHPGTATYLTGAFVAAAVAADVGRRLGDHFARSVYGITAVDVRGEVERLLTAAGLVVAVDLPDTVEDIDGYPAVSDAVERDLAGRTMRFPRRLSRDDLEDRLAWRIREDFPVGHVHVAVSEDEHVELLAVGGSATGLGSSLPPKSTAVAVRCDPSPDASTGDPVEVWPAAEDSEGPITTATFRAAVGDVATLTVDAEDADSFEVGARYKLVTRPDTPNDVNELASIVWEADETVTAVTVDEGGPLQGEFVGWLPVTVLVIDRDGRERALPPQNETLQVGDTVYVIGTPEGLHRLAAYDPRSSPDAEPEPGEDGSLEADLA